jgi:hypothetical protein
MSCAACLPNTFDRNRVPMVRPGRHHPSSPRLARRRPPAMLSLGGRAAPAPGERPRGGRRVLDSRMRGSAFSGPIQRCQHGRQRCGRNARPRLLEEGELEIREQQQPFGFAEHPQTGAERAGRQRRGRRSPARNASSAASRDTECSLKIASGATSSGESSNPSAPAQISGSRQTRWPPVVSQGRFARRMRRPFRRGNGELVTSPLPSLLTDR